MPVAGRTYLIELEPSKTIRDLKQRIASRDGLAVDQQRLVFAGKDLQGNKNPFKKDIS